MRDLTISLLDSEATTPEPETEEMSPLRAQLDRHYDAYVAKYGPINTVKVSETKRLDKNGDPIVRRAFPGTMKTFRTNHHRTAVTALENYDEKTQSATNAPILKPCEAPGVCKENEKCETDRSRRRVRQGKTSPKTPFPHRLITHGFYRHYLQSVRTS